MSAPRTIIHLDMDCFYAAIEVRDAPALAGKPVAVGGARDRRGVLTTCNYEARKYGVRSAMPTYIALRKCPQLIVLPTRFHVYGAESRRIRQIFYRFTELVEPLSLDEAYLDVSHLPHPPAAIASEIRGRILEQTALTASAGIGPNKLVAKIASDWNKPDGQYEVTPEAVPAFMRDLPVRKIWGIGKVSAEKLERIGVRTCGALQAYTRIELHRIFGKFGLELHELCRGIDHRPVEPLRLRKSLGTEQTFNTNLTSLAELEERLAEMHGELLQELAQKEGSREIHKLFVKLKFADFTRTTVERVGDRPLLPHYRQLLAEGFGRNTQSVRLLGLGVRFAEATPASAAQLLLKLGESAAKDS
jgi:DNA polymerase-4